MSVSRGAFRVRGLHVPLEREGVERREKRGGLRGPLGRACEARPERLRGVPRPFAIGTLTSRRSTCGVLPPGAGPRVRPRGRVSAPAPGRQPAPGRGPCVPGRSPGAARQPASAACPKPAGAAPAEDGNCPAPATRRRTPVFKSLPCGSSRPQRRLAKRPSTDEVEGIVILYGEYFKRKKERVVVKFARGSRLFVVLGDADD